MQPAVRGGAGASVLCHNANTGLVLRHVCKFVCAIPFSNHAKEIITLEICAEV